MVSVLALNKLELKDMITAEMVKPGAAVVGWLRTRARALGLVLGIVFLLIISFVVSGLIHALMPAKSAAWRTVARAPAPPW